MDGDWAVVVVAIGWMAAVLESCLLEVVGGWWLVVRDGDGVSSRTGYGQGWLLCLMVREIYPQLVIILCLTYNQSIIALFRFSFRLIVITLGRSE